MAALAISIPACPHRRPLQALGDNPTGFSNPQDLVTGNTVQLDAGYDTAAYTVGAPNEATVDLVTGDVIEDGSTFYRYTGTGENGFSLTDANITGDTTNFVKIGGTASDTYTYVGSGATQVDLANTDYTDSANWKLVPNNFAALAHGAGTPFSNSQTVNFGDLVQLDAGYATPDYTVGAVGQATVNLRAGDVIQDGAALYRYNGANQNNFSLTDAAITGDTTDFKLVGGTNGATYEYMGGTAATLDLANTNYTDLGYWKLITTNVAPEGVKTSPPADGSKSGAENNGAASNDSSSSAAPSNATAVGGILVLNDVRSATHAYVLNATISADTASVSALDKATIDATNDSTVTAASSSLGSQSDNIALNGIIATNLIQNSATAEVTTSSIEATGAGTPVAGQSNAPVTLSIDAENDATIQATNAANTSGSNKSGGIVLAFNTIGLQSGNFLFNAIDALLGNNEVTAAFGASPNTNVTADAHDSTLIADIGSVDITAFQSAKINALTTNSTTSLGPALENASSIAIGAILATNQTNTFAKAFADGGSTIQAGGDITIEATDKSQINATNTEVAASVLQTSATKTPSMVTTYVDQLKQGYQFTSNSGTQTLTPGMIVYNAQDGNYYVYLGELGTNGLKPQDIDLGTTNYTISVALQNNIPEWAPFTDSSVLADLPDFSTIKATGENQGTGSSSTAVGAIFVLNMINASASAYASGSSLSAGVGAGMADFGGGVLIEATNLSTINATNTSTVTASNGQSGPTTTSPGTGLAVNATIATNNVLGSTQAYASGGSITTLGTGGSIDVTGTSDATIDAENDATTDAKTTSVGVVLAFNTIGIASPVAGFLENTVDALFGTDLASEQPDQVYAYMSGTTASASNGIDVSATESSTITANISNAETGLFSSGVSVAATVTLNRVATDVEAWISGGTTIATEGDIDIEATGQATITSTVTTPVVKLAANFSKDSQDPQKATTVGVSIARNILENTVSASAGHTVSNVTTGASLTADDGNINVLASQLAQITATSASAAISVGVSTGGSAGAFAGGGAVAINTILGGVTASSLNSSLTAITGGANTGAIKVAGTYGGMIEATVAAIAAAVSASPSTADAVAIGAAVALNLIGWRGTVADETQDSHAPITLTATISGGSVSAGSTLSVTAQSQATINATTAALAVAIGVSGGSTKITAVPRRAMRMSRARAPTQAPKGRLCHRNPQDRHRRRPAHR